jgi:hypothetical protein
MMFNLVLPLLVTSQAFSVLAHALPHVDAALPTTLTVAPRSGGVFPRDESETWTDYDQNTEALVQSGICRYYLDPSSHSNLSMCQRYCQNNSVMCKAGDTATSPILTNPDNERYVMGECICNTAVPDAIVEFVAEGLSASEGIICEVWLESFVMAGDILSTLVLPAKVSLKAFKTIWGLISKANTVFGLAGLETINDVITEKCGSDVITKAGLTKDLITSASEKFLNLDLSKLTGQ